MGHIEIRTLLRFFFCVFVGYSQTISTYATIMIKMNKEIDVKRVAKDDRVKQ